MANTQPTPAVEPAQPSISSDSTPISHPDPEIRRLIVSYAPLARSPETPMLRLQGRWLERAGFGVGDPVKVYVSPRRLVIEVIEPEHLSQTEVLDRIARVSEGGLPKREVDEAVRHLKRHRTD